MQSDSAEAILPADTPNPAVSVALVVTETLSRSTGRTSEGEAFVGSDGYRLDLTNF